MKKAQGLFFVILSAIIFGYTPILGRLSYDHGSTAVTLAVLRSLLALTLLLVWIAKAKATLKLKKKEYLQILVLSLFGSALTSILLYSSYNMLSVGLATTLHFIYPLVVTVGESLFCSVPFQRSKGIALALALAGIILLCDPTTIHWGGAALALISGFTYGFYLIYLVRTGMEHMHPGTLTFYTCAFNGFWIGLYGILTQSMSFQIDETGWLYTLIVSLLTSFGGVALLQIGVRMIGASTAAIISTFEPLVSVCLGILLLNEELNWKKFLGCSLIVLAVLAVTLLPLWSERRRARSL